MKVLFLLFLFLVSCNYSLDKKKNTGSSEVLKSSELSFDVLYSQILESKCIGCHDGSQPGINVSSYTSVIRNVVKGDPDSSRLYESIKSGRMPKNGQPLSESEQSYIYNWIKAGAPENSLAVVTTTTLETVSLYNRVQTRVFDVHCVSCHSGGEFASAELDLTDFDTFRDSAVAKGLIIPGDADNSEFYKAVFSDWMPDDTEIKVPNVDKLLLKDWINQGAQK